MRSAGDVAHARRPYRKPSVEFTSSRGLASPPRRATALTLPRKTGVEPTETSDAEAYALPPTRYASSTVLGVVGSIARRWDELAAANTYRGPEGHSTIAPYWNVAHSVAGVFTSEPRCA